MAANAPRKHLAPDWRRHTYLSKTLYLQSENLYSAPLHSGQITFRGLFSSVEWKYLEPPVIKILLLHTYYYCYHTHLYSLTVCIRPECACLSKSWYTGLPISYWCTPQPVQLAWLQFGRGKSSHHLYHSQLSREDIYVYTINVNKRQQFVLGFYLYHYHERSVNNTTQVP